MSDKRYTVVSMFSGCGGMDLGFLGGFEVLRRDYEALPFRVVWANDSNDAACRSYRRNIQGEIVCADVWTTMETLPARADVLIGGFPCQDISVNGKRAGIRGKRSGLYRAMIEAIERTKPRIFVAENVKGLLLSYNRKSLEKVLSDFKELGYAVSHQLYNASDYGVPQTRERVFIVGCSQGVGPFLPPFPETISRPITAKDALRDLEGLREGEIANHIWSRAHESPEQGSRRLKPDRPGYTIRAECHGNIQFHYKHPRRISMREAARLQSFPDDFIFDAKLRETERQIGNAVPPVLAWHIARAVAGALGWKSSNAVKASKDLSVA